MNSVINLVEKTVIVYEKEGAKQLVKKGFTFFPKLGKKSLFKLLIGTNVLSGPFCGMKYIDKSNGSAFFPKILGCYEKEISPMVENTINSNYRYLIDIGCAEGYYAVGFAYRRKSKNPCCVFAYDINKKALFNLQKLAELNNVNNFIKTNGICTHEELNQFNKYKGEPIFLICDIEGAEKELIDPSKAPVLLDFDMLIEVHDIRKEDPVIEKTLRNRFQNTHKISIIKCRKRTEADLKELNNISYWKRKLIGISYINEGRDYATDWMLLQKL